MIKSCPLPQLLKKYPRSKKMIIDGCIVVDTGVINYYTKKGVRHHYREPYKIYDMDGNVFFGNYKSVEKATRFIEGQKSFGLTAVLGPVAPFPYGKSNKDIYPEGVGVYYKLEEEQK